MKKAILIGMSGCGKTTLIQRVENEALVYAKTQVVRQHLGFIDTPGEYLEQRRLYRALIISSVDADEIGLVQDCVAGGTWIPPSFATTFAKPIFGVVTKTDLATTPGQLAYARDVLHMGGAARVFEVSAVTGAGIADLVDYLNEPPRAAARPAERPAPRRVRTGGASVLSPEFGDIAQESLARADQATRDMTLVGGAR